MRHIELTVRRDGNTVINRTAPPWEIPVIEFAFDPGNVQVSEKSVTIEREYPEPAVEFARLEKLYGADTKSGDAHVASVYGKGHAGLRGLAKAIAEAQAADEAVAKAAAKSPSRGRKPATAPLQADPLLV